MKRSKIIIRFLEKNDSESICRLLSALFDDWKAVTHPTVKVEQYVRSQLKDVGDFVSELDESLQHGQFSELGFYVLVRQFFEKDSFVSRELFMNEFLMDWKLNSVGSKKKKIRRVINFLNKMNKSL